MREDLAAWQKLNVTAFLSGGLAGCYREMVGERYSDASGGDYGPLVRQPILVFTGAKEELARSLTRARDRGIMPSIYTVDLFRTFNRAAVAGVSTSELDLAGIALYGQRKLVDKVIKGLKLHP